MAASMLRTRRRGSNATLAAVGVGMILLLSACTASFTPAQSAEETQAQADVQRDIGAFVDGLTSTNTFPLQVDSVTTVDEVAAETNAVHYYYTVTGQKQSVDDEKALEKTIIQAVCNADNTKDLVNRGVHMIHSYTYADTGGRFVVNVAKASCS